MPRATPIYLTSVQQTVVKYANICTFLLNKANLIIAIIEIKTNTNSFSITNGIGFATFYLITLNALTR